jgi:hypothetical protein
MTVQRILLIIYAIIIIVIAFAFTRESFYAGSYIFEERHSQNAALGILGLSISTFFPIITSLITFLFVHSNRRKLMLHFCTISIITIFYFCGNYLFYYGAGIPKGALPAEYAILMATILLALTLLAHTIAILVEFYKLFAIRS